MQCFCCRREVTIGRKAKVRRLIDFDPNRGGPDSAAYHSYLEEVTYRWAVVCPQCYLLLDGLDGSTIVDGERFTMAGQSRQDRAVTLNEAKYRAWQKQEAAKLGLGIEATSS